MQKKWLLYLILKILLFLLVFFASIYNLIYFYDRFNEGPTWWKYFLLSFFLFPWELSWIIFKQTSFIEKVRNLPDYFSELTKRILEKIKREWRKITWFETDFINRAVKVTIFLTVYLLVIFIQYIFRYSETRFWAWYINYIVIIFLGIVSIRQSFRYLFPSVIKYLEINAASFLWKKIINRPNTIRLFSFILMAALLAAALTFVLQPEKRLVYEQKEDTSIVNNSIRITYVELQPEKKLTGEFEIIEYPHKYFPGYWSNGDIFYDVDEYIEPTGVPPILIDDNIVINGKTAIINEPQQGIFSYPSATVQFELALSGSDFYFPFDQYTGVIHIKIKEHESGSEYSAEITPKASYTLLSEFNNRTYKVNLSKNNLDWNNIVIYVGYSRYYQLLVSIIGFVLLAFLFLIFTTNQKDQLVELSVGVFATIITLRGFLIPQELDGSPLFLDQVLLFYIVLFLIAILYKYGQKKQLN